MSMAQAQAGLFPERMLRKAWTVLVSHSAWSLAHGGCSANGRHVGLSPNALPASHAGSFRAAWARGQWRGSDGDWRPREAQGKVRENIQGQKGQAGAHRDITEKELPAAGSPSSVGSRHHNSSQLLRNLSNCYGPIGHYLLPLLPIQCQVI